LDDQGLSIEIEILLPQRECLRDPQARSPQERDEGGIAHTSWCSTAAASEDLLDLALREEISIETSVSTSRCHFQ
jgi:hypothetical protein